MLIQVGWSGRNKNAQDVEYLNGRLKERTLKIGAVQDGF